MRARAVLVLLALFVGSVAAWIGHEEESNNKDLFMAFQLQYDKVFPTEEEFNKRFAIFTENLRTAEALNAASTTAQFGVTKFMDLTFDEFQEQLRKSRVQQTLGGATEPAPSITRLQMPASSPPNTWDWRTKGVVTGVNDQGQCGSCWAFTVVENIESLWAIAGHPLTKLATDQILQCDTGDEGCNGGDFPSAYEYVMKYGLEPAADYPYEAGACQYNPHDVLVHIKNWTFVTTSRNERQMLDFVYNVGPIAIAVDASSAAWQFYTGGVLTGSQCPNSVIDHTMVIEGYDLSAPTPYWIARNSWGPDWGLNGYILLQFDVNACGLAEYVTSAVL